MQSPCPWTAPADNGGADITGYVLQSAYKDADDTMTDFMTIAATDAATWWNHAGLPDDRTTPFPPTCTPAPGSDDPNADPRSPYCKMYDVLAEDAKMVVDATFAANYGTITGTSYMDTSLMPETMYYYRVAAMNSVGMGEYSDGMDMATTEATDTVPGVPTAVTAMETSDTEITVTWGSPASDGGADITGYMVESAYMMADDTMSEWMAVDPAHSGMMMEYMDTGLMPETTYYYRVLAMNAAGNGEWSDGMASAMTDPTPVMTELGMAANLRIGVNSGGTIQVTWDAADNAVGYIVIAIDRSDFSPKSAPVNPDTAGVTNTTLNLGGLTVGNNYYVYVAATGSAGDNTLSIPPLEVTAE